MGCGCQNKRYTQASPMVIGEDTGPTYLIVPTITVANTKRGEKTWVRGSSIPEFVSKGWFHIVSVVEPEPV